jgi:DNA-binding NarL/FixJ family response regulator
MPYISGIDAVKMVKEKFSGIKIIMQTIFDDDEKIFQSIYAGASGYILKNTTSERILDFIFDVYNGGAAMSPSVATKVLKMVQPPVHELKKETFNLTEREIEVLNYIAKGMNNKTIADCCFITIEAVKKRISSIYEKLHVHSKSEAIAKAFQNKIL